MDEDGYLLDENGEFLLDNQGNKVVLSNEQKLMHNLHIHQFV